MARKYWTEEPNALTDSASLAKVVAHAFCTGDDIRLQAL